MLAYARLMCVAVAMCAVVPATAAAELVDTVQTAKSRGDLSGFLVRKAEAAAEKRDYGRAIVLYQALVTARGPGSPEARKLATIWTLAAQSSDAARVLEAYAAATSDPKARAEARAEATRLNANPDPFSKQLELPPLVGEAKQAFKLGRAAFGKKQFGDALVYFHMGYVLAPDLPGFLRELGATYEKLNARDKKVDFYRAYLQRRPFGKNADEVRKELSQDKGALATLSIESSLPCEDVWVNRQPVPGKLPQKKLLVAPGDYRALCLSRKYEIAIFEDITVTAGQKATLKFTWAIVVNQLTNPYGRIAIENPKRQGTLLDLGVSSPEIGVLLPDDGRALKMVVKDDSGSRVEERSVRIRPGERFVVKW
jgi:tetratricopeptide (TPR) repeat protein